MPASANAYVTTSQSVARINETSALFSITYSFGHSEHETYLPVWATRSQAWGSQSNSIGYEVLKSGKVTETASTIGVVISDTSITLDDMYQIAKGKSQSLTLYVVLTTENNTPIDNYSIRVTDLPFYWDKSREYMKLNPSELKYYQTPTIKGANYVNNSSASFTLRTK